MDMKLIFFPLFIIVEIFKNLNKFETCLNISNKKINLLQIKNDNEMSILRRSEPLRKSQGFNL